MKLIIAAVALVVCYSFTTVQAAPKVKVPLAPGETTTKKPKLINETFWAPPTIAPNVTSPVVIDPAYWAAKKTLFTQKLFAALAAQILASVNSTTAAPVTDAPAAADVSVSARAVAAAGPPEADPATAKAAKKSAKKEAAKTKKTKAKGGPPPFVLAKLAKTTEAPTPEPTTEDATAHPTLDYASLAKALLT